MPRMHSRRDFAVTLSAGGTAALLRCRSAFADEGPPETATIRLRRDPSICVAPWYVGEDLLRAEGFTDIQYVPVKSGAEHTRMLASGEIDFTSDFAITALRRIEAGVPITAFAGLHSGCFELFAHEPIGGISELRGRKVSVDALMGGKHQYMAMMAAHVGLDPSHDIEWLEGPGREPMQLFADGKVDAFLAFPPEPQELRARKIGRAILSTTTEKPWSQYFCCMLVGNRDFIRAHPIATKRVLRAVLKASEICAAQPETAAQRLVDGGFTQRYDYALQTLTELPYGRWRDFDPEDSLRFYALRLHEIGMIKSDPKALIAVGTDWRFLNELKRELKV